MKPRTWYPGPDEDWYRSEQGKGMCRKCGEERLVHKISDGWGEQNFCKVCSHSWKITNPEWQTREQAGKPIVRFGSTGE